MGILNNPSLAPRTLLALAGVALACHVAPPATALATGLSWSNAAGGSAATAANWSPAQIPGPADTLSFNLANTYTVTLPVGVAAVTSHTYKRGAVTLSITSPHTTSSFVRVADVAGDSAQVTLSAGTLRAGTGVTVGNAAGSTGTLTVDNEVGRLETTAAGSDIVVGSAGTGTLNITDGALVQPVDDVIVAAIANSTGHLTVSGAGAFPLPVPSSTLNLPAAGQDLTIGQSGDGFLDVAQGAIVSADEMFVALNAGSNGVVTVGGTGGLLNTPAQINIATSLHLGDNPNVGANGGSASFTVNVGAEVTVGGTTRIGDPTNNIGSGTLTINGGTFTTSALIATDSGGFLNLFGGELRVRGGALQIRNDVLTLGITPGSSPNLFLEDGASCTLSNNASPFEALVIGQSNFAAVHVFGPSHLTIAAGDMIIGNLVNGNGFLEVTSPGASLTAPSSRFIILGDAGSGAVFVRNGGTVNSGSVFLGRAATGSGAVEVNNDAGAWSITGVLAIGGTNAAAGGIGSVLIGGDGFLANGTVNVNSGVIDAVRVWGSGDSLTIGRGGLLTADGRVRVGGAFTLDGGAIDSRELLLQTPNTAFNLAGSIAGGLQLDAGALNSSIVLTGDLHITDGSTSAANLVNNGTMEIGDHTLSIESIAPAGRQVNTCHLGRFGRLESNVQLLVRSGRTLSGGGVVDAPISNSGLIAGENTGLTFSKILSGLGQGITGSTITFASGGGFTGSGDFSTTTPVNALAGSVITATDDLAMGNPLLASGFFSAGRIVIGGQFRVTLRDADHAFVADVVLADDLAQSPALFCATGLTVNRGVVSGSGSLSAVSSNTFEGITVRGVLSPGTPAAPGRLRLFGDVALNPAAALEFDVFGAESHDQILIPSFFITTNPPFGFEFNPTVPLAGQLVLRVAPDHSPTPAERHQLLTAAGGVTGAFDSVSAPLRWVVTVNAPGFPGVWAAFCPAEFNGDNAVDPDDLADYIASFFAVPPLPAADFNSDGVTDPDDLSDYIAAFFGGCA